LLTWLVFRPALSAKDLPRKVLVVNVMRAKSASAGPGQILVTYNKVVNIFALDMIGWHG